MNAELAIWTVYQSPLDYPGRVVARRFLLDRPTDQIIIGSSLEEVRAQLPYGMLRIERSPSDEAHIVEVWL